jgi:maltooligosyltrehalose synthase
MTPRATYRFQFHKDFTFADAEALVPYLDDLGISHVYASPITTARSGSTHGYDVVDPTCINPELGGEEAFRSLVATLRARAMGIIIDIVPNHMGVAGGENTWWNDVITHGRESEFARYFDIDWREKLVLPILGDPLAETLASGALKVEQVDGRYILEAYTASRSATKTRRRQRPTTSPRWSTASITASRRGAPRTTNSTGGGSSRSTTSPVFGSRIRSSSRPRTPCTSASTRRA